jgi:hypothetical protein
LLTIIDDYSRRIFGFLAKSQSDWFDIWSKFIVRVEAELGRANCQTESASALLALTETQLETITPKSADRALASTSREQWLAAMNREKQCHCKNGTFGEEWQKADPCPKPIPAGWVFKIKHRGEPIEEKTSKPSSSKPELSFAVSS